MSYKSFEILLVESYLLYMSVKRIEREIKQKSGGSSRGPAKNLGGAMAHPGPLYNRHCGVIIAL